jgi:NADH-ubiquinone oxidoreductase chain 5
MIFLVILFPLLGFFGGFLFGKYLGRGSCIITTGGILLSLLVSLNLFYNILVTGVVYKTFLGSWIPVDYLELNWCFYIDSLTCVMLIVVTFISSLVHLYSIEYMSEDPHLPRFMSYLSLFSFFMLILITAGNFLQMFVGWEGVGLASYLLINFWFTRIQANKSAIKAMLVNRVGDFFILLSLFTIYSVFNTLDYSIIFNLAPLKVNEQVMIGSIAINVIDLICILLFLGAMGKSAQLGLHTWLPDAMEGPTPVSALIHAATMVTAGVFLIARCSFLFEYSSFALSTIMIVGACTAFFASTTGLFQSDLKKVIAYSTCSQLGYMIFACGLSSYDVGVFHLSNHAFFKALLFLGAGSVIHAVSDEQDMRKMGGLKSLLPFSYSIMLIGSLALIGFPFLTGFYSKDIILEVAFAKYTTLGHFCYFLGSFAAFFTAFYSTRVIFLVFLSEPNGNRSTILNAHEGSWKLTFPLLILALLSILVGYITKELFIGFGTNFWGSSLFTDPINYYLLDVEFIFLFYKLMPLILTVLGASCSFFLYSLNVESYYEIKKTPSFKIFFNFLSRKWYFDRLYNQFAGQNVLYYGYEFCYKDIDRGIIERIGPIGLIDTITNIFNSLRKYQSGNIFHYLLIFFVFILLFSSLLLFTFIF